MVSPDFRIRVSETLVALVKGARPPLGGRAQVLPAVVVRRQREDCWTLDPSTVSQGTSMGGEGEMGTRGESGLPHTGLRDIGGLGGRNRASLRWAEGRAQVLLGVVVRM